MRIYTIGYGNQAAEVFFGRIPEGALLVDVREQPYFCSQKEYQAAALAKRFERRYMGAPMLGNMFHQKHRWCPPSMTVAKGLLYGIAKKMAKDRCSVCFMCACGSSDGCHRVLVAEMLARMINVPEIHL